MTDDYIPINHCYYTMRYMAVLLPKSFMINRNINRAEEGAIIFGEMASAGLRDQDWLDRASNYVI